MTQWVRLFSPLFIATLVALAGSALSLGLLHSIVDECSVGFRTTGEPLGAGQVGQCLGYELASAILVVVGLVSGALTIWLSVRFLNAGTERARAQNADVPGPSETSSASPPRWLTRLTGWPTYRWVCVLVAVFFVASFFGATWLYLHLSPFDDDLAINQQVLSSTILGGKPYQFYETFNCEVHGQCSYLEVHQAFFGFAIASAYGIAPTPFTLFAIQSLALGIAALPLYAIAVDVIGSRRLALLVASTYLAWSPLLILATKDTFNWEAFLPVELLTIFLLWSRRKYLLALPVVLVTFLTYETNPVLVFFVGVYFVWPWLVKAARLLFRSLLAEFTEPRLKPSKLRLWLSWVRRALQVKEVYASLALMVASVVAYVLLRLFVLDGTWLLALPPVPSAYALPVSSPNKVFVLSFGALSFMWSSKLVFWITLYLTLGFVPLFAPRAFLLVLPWVVLSAFNFTPAFWSFTGHYVIPAAAALMIGFTFGLDRLYRFSAANSSRATATLPEVPRSQNAATSEADNPRGRRRREWTLDSSTSPGSARAVSVLTAGVIVIIAGNLILNPLNPLAGEIAPNLGPPFPLSNGFSYSPIPNDQPLEQLVSIIPKNAIVAAPVSVISLVANDPYAYVLQGHPFNRTLLPDNESTRTAFVLLPYETPVYQLNTTLLQTLFDRFDFGVRGCVNNSAVGGVELFQSQYTGSPTTFGPSDALCPNYFAGGAGLSPVPPAILADNSSSPAGVVLTSTGCADVGNTVWTGPGIEVPAGQYRASVVVNAFNESNASCAKLWNSGQSVLKVNITAQNESTLQQLTFAQKRLNESFFCPPPEANGSRSSCMNPANWFDWNVSFTVPPETNNLSFSGTVLIGQYIVQVAYVALFPNPIT